MITLKEENEKNQTLAQMGKKIPRRYLRGILLFVLIRNQSRPLLQGLLYLLQLRQEPLLQKLHRRQR